VYEKIFSNISMSGDV